MICKICGKKEELTTPIEQMTKELDENYVGFKPGDCEIVCDDCYNKPKVQETFEEGI